MLLAVAQLAALMGELAAVQKAPSTFKLSEPNVVEVVQKLAELGLVEVLYTTNGKEYLTPKQLRNEVEDEILAHGGRINLTELAPILNVDLPHVERAVEAVLASDASLQLFQGEIIATHYLDGVAEDINQTLQGAGRVTLAELAVQYTLPTEYVAKFIEPRIGTIIQAKLAAGVLYTAAYVARHSARVRGVLCAVLRPTSLASLIREHAFTESLFYECVDELKATGQLPGAVQGKSSYTPAVHAHAQVRGEVGGAGRAEGREEPGGGRQGITSTPGTTGRAPCSASPIRACCAEAAAAAPELPLLRRCCPPLRRSCPLLRRSCPPLRRSCPPLRRSCPLIAPRIASHVRRFTRCAASSSRTA